MKLYMIRRVGYNGKFEYRAAGTYNTWSRTGKCWSGIGAFKSFLNYGGYCSLNDLKKECQIKDVDIIEIDVDNETVTPMKALLWLELNMNPSARK